LPAPAALAHAFNLEGRPIGRARRLGKAAVARPGRTLVYDFGFLGFGLSWFASAVLSDISISERIASLRNARLPPSIVSSCVTPDSQETKTMSDDSGDFSWRETDAVVVRQQDAIAVYSNPDGDLVIRRRQAWDEDEDVWIVVAQTQIPTVIDAMEKVLKEVQSRVVG